MFAAKRSGPTAKRRRSLSSEAGFTLVEIMVTVGITALLGGAALVTMSSSQVLFAKNVSVNTSHTSTRSAFDRLAHELSRSNSKPVSLTAAGAVSANSPDGAPGITFDLYLGGPYIIDRDEQTLTAGTTQIRARRATNGSSASIPAPAPLPSAGDILIIDGSSQRPGVSTATDLDSNPGSPGDDPLTIRLTGGLSATISQPDKLKTAWLVRQVAFLCVTNGDYRELRYYPNFTPGMTNIHLKSNYSTLSNSLSPKSTDANPFTVIISDSKSGKSHVLFKPQILDRQFDKALGDSSRGTFYTNASLDVTIYPRSDARSFDD